MITLLSFSFGFLLLTGVPIVFAMLAAAIAALAFGNSMPMELVAQRLVNGLDNFTFLAIPMFVLAGTIMDESGIAARLCRLAEALVGHIPGGLGHAVVVTDIFFSGMSGSTLADASAVASLTYPGLRQSGYSQARATAMISAVGSIGILFPPCLTMVIVGALLGMSITALFLSGLIPGLLMAGAMMATIYVQARIGTLPAAQLVFSWRMLAVAFRDSIVAMLMPIIMFGGIFGGVFSPTEAAAVAVLYALVVGVVTRSLGFSDIGRIFVRTAITTAAIGLLLGAAAAFSTLLSLEMVPTSIAQLMRQLPQSPLIFLIIANLIFVIFGALLDGVAALLLFLPILMPAARVLGIDPLHFALTSIASLGLGVIIPPIGIMLLVICAITKSRVADVSRLMTPYVLLRALTILVIILVPWLVLVLPRSLGF
jgi:tripartite ATP-independent transporter DctM subunit